MDEAAAPKKKSLLLPLTIVLVIALTALCGLYFLYPKTAVTPKQEETKKTSDSGMTVLPSTSSSKPLTDQEAITKILAAKAGVIPEVLKVTISTNSAGFVKGTVSQVGEETGGGYFLAAKVGGSWLLAYDGQATPDCSTIEMYNFPKSMVTECLDQSGKLKIR